MACLVGGIRERLTVGLQTVSSLFKDVFVTPLDTDSFKQVIDLAFALIPRLGVTDLATSELCSRGYLTQVMPQTAA